jgi:hypothetical protein
MRPWYSAAIDGIPSIEHENMTKTKFTGCMRIAFWLACFSAGSVGTTLWLRSYWRSDVGSYHGVEAISMYHYLLIGGSDHVGEDPEYETGPAMPAIAGGIGGVLWAEFFGDIENGPMIGWDDFQVSWRRDVAPYWFILVPWWSIALPPSSFVIFTALRRLLNRRSRPIYKSWRRHLWLLIYAPTAALLICAWIRNNHFHLGHPESAARDRLIDYAIKSFGLTFICYVWRYAGVWNRLSCKDPQGFEVMQTDEHT